MTSAADPRIRHLACQGASRPGPAGPGDARTHRLAYWEWRGRPGRPAEHIVLCVHGLTRNGRDFDALARNLADGLPGAVSIICPDVAGRGQSDWLADPQDYQVPFYVADMARLVQALADESREARGPGAPAPRLDWLGTSMGGFIGMGYTALPQAPLPIDRLILNDVGPAMQWDALARIGEYLGKQPRFDSIAQGAAYLRSIAAGFGPHSDEAWLALSRHQFRQLENGQFTLHYDAAIPMPQDTGRQALEAGEKRLWAIYDAITARTLLLRGRESDFLAPATAAQMRERGPRARVAEFDGVGHAPTLVAQEQRRAVLDFLLEP